MKKSTAVAMITALTIGAVGVTSLSPALARGGPDGHGPRINFEEIDANADGQITIEEMIAHREAKFAERDTNGDGFLSKEELLAAMQENAAKRQAKRVDHMIDRQDADDDGQLSMAELSNDERQAKFFERLDENGDGAISEEELENMKKHRFGGKKKRPASE